MIRGIMEIHFTKLHELAKMPVKAHPDDAGFDLFAASWGVQSKGEYNQFEYGTGIAMEIPPGYVGLIYPRSSISNTDLTLANSVGVIDAGYTGEIKLRFNSPTALLSNYYKVGDKIGQLVIIPLPEISFREVPKLGPSFRSTNGFGSSGR